MKILLAVDGSKASLEAVDCVIDHTDWYREKPEVELVTVHLPVPKLPGMGMAVGKAQIERYYEEEGQQTLAAARKLPPPAQVPDARMVGDIANPSSSRRRARAAMIPSLARHVEIGRRWRATAPSAALSDPVLLVKGTLAGVRSRPSAAAASSTPPIRSRAHSRGAI